MEDAIKRLEAVASRLEKVALKAAGGGADADPEELPEGYVEMKAIFDNEGKAFIDLWAGIDGGDYAKVEVPVQKVMQSCMDNVLQLLAVTNKCKKPDDNALVAAMKPMQDAIKESQDIAKTRKKKWRTYDDYHVVLSEFCIGFNWVFYKPPNLPKPMWDAQTDAMVTAMQSKCWKKKKDEHKDHMRAWMNAGKALCAKVSDVIKAHYKVGVEFWGQEDFALGDAPAAAPAAASENKEEEVAAKEEPKKEEPKKAQKDFAAELSKGLNVTSGLKKVKKEQKNKYKKEKVVGKVSGGASKARIKKKKEAKRQKRGQTWFFNDYQNMQGESMVKIDNEEEYDLKKSLYLCAAINADFQVGNKVKTITLDSCKRTRVQVDKDIISSIELVNCSSCTIFVNGTVPSITMDKCDSPQIIFTQGGWDAEKPKPNILYSSCSAANIVLPNADGSDVITYALPEQFKFLGGNAEGIPEIEVLQHKD